jgi:hypothetical protein
MSLTFSDHQRSPVIDRHPPLQSKSASSSSTGVTPAVQAWACAKPASGRGTKHHDVRQFDIDPR